MIPADSPLLRPLISDDPNSFLLSNAATFSFAPAGLPVDTREFLGRESDTINWTEAQMEYVRETFAYIETVVNLTFDEVSGSSADIEFHQVPFLDGETVGYTDRLGPGEVLIVLPTEFTGPTALGTDNTTVIHEIGHAIGLDHPFEGPDAFPGVSGPFDPGDFSLSTELATRLAYAPGESFDYPNLDIRGEPASFGALDIAALQVVYGANETTGLGDTSYGINSDLLTIWDNGGTDAIDFSTATDATVIDLRPATLQVEAGGGGFLSYIAQDGGTVANGGYTIAFGVEIESALGGHSDDVLIGNAGDNWFTGGRGNDHITGGDGLDTAFYETDQVSYTFVLSEDGATLTDRRAGGDGTDTLLGVEALMFGDAAIAPFELSRFDGGLDLAETEMESFIELYIAYFNRAPDAIGLNFWGTAFANGTTFQEMAALFTDQDETRATYDENLSNGDFISAVYNNVLGRVADGEGFDFWLGVLDSGARSRDQFILSVLEGVKVPIAGGSAEIQAQQVADQQYLSAKTDIGTFYSVTRGLSNVQNASEAMSIFDGTADSILAAQNAIDDFYTIALNDEDGEFIFQLVGVIDDPFGAMG